LYVVGQARDPAADDIGDGQRDVTGTIGRLEPVLALHQANELGDEEGIAVGALLKPTRDVVDLRPGQIDGRPQEIGDVAWGEPRQKQPLDAGSA